VDPNRIEAVSGGSAPVPVWDRPVRVVHWLVALLIPVSWYTAENDIMDWHYRSGIAILGLVLFRLIWGVIGSSTARFVGFVKGPRGVADYLRGRSGHVLGHNPLGALSVVGLLGMLSLQVGLGLFASDEDGLNSGPLSHLVSQETAEAAKDWHELGWKVLLVLIVLHVAAILFYLAVKRRNLVRPMITGVTEAPAGTVGMHGGGAVRFLVAVGVAFAVMWWVAAQA
jgi:cytochrome b